jgi:hypothetical protein
MANNCVEFAKYETERLKKGIAILEDQISRNNETVEAWSLIARNGGSDTNAVYRDFAHAETDRLHSENLALEEEIHRSNETGLAWETILRNAASGVQVVRTVAAEAVPQRTAYAEPEPEPVHYEQEESEPEPAAGPGWASTYVSKMGAMKDSLLNACEKTLNLADLRKRTSLDEQPREQFQGLGLR